MQRTRHFQSHYGAIATAACAIIKRFVMTFQSHYGAIATTPFALYQLEVEAFNPTMVRLQLGYAQARLEGDGTFNPTMVRLQLSVTSPRR